MLVDNPWLQRRVLAYAHQGGEREAPSSTLFAIELDVHATADGRLVVCHDATLDRTTNGRGAISKRPAHELAGLDAAWNFVPGEGACPGRDPSQYVLRGKVLEDPRLGVATLEAVLEATRGVPLNLDVKQTAPLVAPYEASLGELLREHERTHDVIVASFHEAAIAAIRQLAPEIAVSPQRRALAAFLLAVRTHRRPPAALRQYAALQVPVRHRGVRIVNRRFVHEAHAAGLAVHVWTVNDPSEMERLVDDGVDGIMTDVPSVASSLLDRLGVSRGRASPRKR